MDAQGYVAFSVNNGTAMFGLLSKQALAGPAGVSPEGSGFGGIVLSYVVSARTGSTRSWPRPRRPDRRAGPREVGTYGGHFADPDGYLWNVGVRAGQPIAAE